MTPAASVAHLRGILLMATAFTLFPAMDAAAKYLTGDLHVLQIVWGRYLFQTVFVLVFVFARHPVGIVKTERWALQIGRAVVLWASNPPIIFALAFIPLADALALNLVAPLLVTALSAPLLAEKVESRRWIAVVVGFIGAIIVLRPGLGIVHWSAGLVLLSAVFFALYQIATRRLSDTEHPSTMLFYTATIGLVISSLVVPAFWTPPTLADWGVMGIMGFVFGLCHFLLIKAFESAPASLLAPFSYLQIVGGAVLGYLVFGDVPDHWAILGGAVIILSGLYIAYREGVQRP